MSDAADLNILRGIILIVLMLAFLGIWAWAWHRNRKPEFTRASMLPLEEDNGTIPPRATGNSNGSNDGETASPRSDSTISGDNDRC